MNVAPPKPHPFLVELDHILHEEVTRCAEILEGVHPNMAVLTIHANGKFVIHGLAQVTTFGVEGTADADVAYGYYVPFDPAENPRWMHLRREHLWPLDRSLPKTGELPPREESPFRIAL